MSLHTFQLRVVKSVMATTVALYLRCLYLLCIWPIAFTFTVLMSYRSLIKVLIAFLKEWTLPVTAGYGLILFEIIMCNACVTHLIVYYEHRNAPEGHYDGMRPFEFVNEVTLMVGIYIGVWGAVEALHSVETTNVDHHLVTGIAKLLGVVLLHLLCWIACVDDWKSHLSFEPPEVEHIP